DVNDAAAAAGRDHLLCYGLRAIHGAVQVRVDEQIEVLRGDVNKLPERGLSGNAGVINEDVDVPPALCDGFHAALDGAAVAEVDLEACDAGRAEPLDGFESASAFELSNGDASAALGEHLHGGEPDPGCAAGHQRDFPRQAHSSSSG